MRDYLALGASLMLAFIVWLVHNLSLDYSSLVQRSVIVTCEIDGHSNLSAGPSEIAASCQMNGFDLIGVRTSSRHPSGLKVEREDMHHKDGDLFYMTSADLTKYFHEIFTDKSRLEYFVSDTVFFVFNSVEYKKVPVQPTSNIDFRPQYMSVGGLKIQPDSVLVYGNKEVIDEVDVVYTELLRLHDLDSEHYGKLKIKSIPGVRISAKSVDYSIVAVRYVQRETQVPVKVVGVPEGLRVKVLPSNATLRYRMRFPADVSMDRTFVAVDYEDFVNSIKGKCIGHVEELPGEVLQYELQREVFDCLLETE